jgi:hypothetical protein
MVGLCPCLCTAHTFGDSDCRCAPLLHTPTPQLWRVTGPACCGLLSTPAATGAPASCCMLSGGGTQCCTVHRTHPISSALPYAPPCTLPADTLYVLNTQKACKAPACCSATPQACPAVCCPPGPSKGRVGLSPCSVIMIAPIARPPSHQRSPEVPVVQCCCVVVEVPVDWHQHAAQVAPYRQHVSLQRLPHRLV